LSAEPLPTHALNAVASNVAAARNGLRGKQERALAFRVIEGMD
jgi:hypothetical protein